MILSLILIVVISLALFEILIYFVVKSQSKKFSWIITSRDDYPDLDQEALKKFISNSFDRALGWVRRPNTKGVEKGKYGNIEFHINKDGARANKYDMLKKSIAVFGDSYSFCRQVEDDETWEAQLSEIDNIGVLNFGVGNYGVDQALLRYESIALPDSVSVVIMGFVPETICRIQSYWKHYLEFGNTFAFKPKFDIDDEGNLQLIENAMSRFEDFNNLSEKIDHVRDNDFFYKNKFIKYQFRFPYSLSFFRKPLHNSLLFLSLLLRIIMSKLGFNINSVENLPFKLVMTDNLKVADKFYHKHDSTELLTSILIRFKNDAERNGHLPLVIVMPQLLDLKLNMNRKASYQIFYEEMSNHISLIDLTDDFKNHDIEKLYINDQYGGHLSPEGNQVVARRISSWLMSNHKTNRDKLCV
jgi:hypothetical protein